LKNRKRICTKKAGQLKEKAKEKKDDAVGKLSEIKDTIKEKLGFDTTKKKDEDIAMEKK